MSDKPEALQGKGPRPRNPHVAILWAAARGKGLHLSKDDVWTLRWDDAIETHATHVTEGEPHER